MNLGNVQQSAVVPCAGYQSIPLRTGYEGVIASRCSDYYAHSAAEDGIVLDVNPKRIRVQYKSGQNSGAELGTKHGVVAGEIVPHLMITDMVKGQTFRKGDILAWDSAFFERDFFSRSNVVMKTGVRAIVALLENNDTLEDGSAISPRLSKALSTTISKCKSILVRFDQSVRDLVQVGDEMDYDSILCKLSEQELDDQFNESALLALTKFADKAPKAKFSGKIARMEVFYYGNPADMTPSLREIVENDNRERARRVRDLGVVEAVTGEVDEPTFIGGEKILPQTAVIKIFIDQDLPSGIGDKAVFCNQLKSVHGRTMVGRNETASGRPVDAIFGYRSINDRIVLSPTIMGTYNLALEAMSNELLRRCRNK